MEEPPDRNDLYEYEGAGHNPMYVYVKDYEADDEAEDDSRSRSQSSSKKMQHATGFARLVKAHGQQLVLQTSQSESVSSGRMAPSPKSIQFVDQEYEYDDDEEGEDEQDMTSSSGSISVPPVPDNRSNQSIDPNARVGINVGRAEFTRSTQQGRRTQLQINPWQMDVEELDDTADDQEEIGMAHSKYFSAGLENGLLVDEHPTVEIESADLIRSSVLEEETQRCDSPPYYKGQQPAGQPSKVPLAKQDKAEEPKENRDNLDKEKTDEMKGRVEQTATDLGQNATNLHIKKPEENKSLGQTATKPPDTDGKVLPAKSSKSKEKTAKKAKSKVLSKSHSKKTSEPTSAASTYSQPEVLLQKPEEQNKPKDAKKKKSSRKCSKHKKPRSKTSKSKSSKTSKSFVTASDGSAQPIESASKDHVQPVEPKPVPPVDESANPIADMSPVEPTNLDNPAQVAEVKSSDGKTCEVLPVPKAAEGLAPDAVKKPKVAKTAKTPKSKGFTKSGKSAKPVSKTSEGTKTVTQASGKSVKTAKSFTTKSKSAKSPTATVQNTQLKTSDPSGNT